ncbi:MAG: UxaA family hydrolase [Rickettsiales bacterium]|jgi:altronate hydrolase|nr:UxaA family hydrolase [Rickettsiales bacterium]
MKAQDLHTLAIIVEETRDNVAVAKCFLKKNTSFYYGNSIIVLSEDIGIGERFAIETIYEGKAVFQFGYPFGTSTGIKCGERISSANVVARLPRRIYGRRQNLGDLQIQSKYKTLKFMGYRRSDGSSGTRNYYIVVPTSMCASATATLIANKFKGYIQGIDGVVALPSTEGCGCAGGVQIERYLTVIRNFILHPNVVGALLIDLGCEQTNAVSVRHFFENVGLGARTDLQIDWLTIQKEGGVTRTIHTAESLITERLVKLSKVHRCECPISHLIIGTECGASDTFSGISANRVIGNAVDKVIYGGGSAIMSEIPEMRGTEPFLFPRMRNRQSVDKFKSIVRWYIRLARRLNYNINDNLVPENRFGGLFNLYIKSLGAVMKGGTTAIQGVVEYAEIIQDKGLHIMQGPGNDLESVTGLSASGSNIICFSTGRGTVTGSAIVPVIKISSTTDLFNRMPNDIDFDAGMVLNNQDVKRSVEEFGTLLLEEIIAVASGKRTCSERNDQRQFQVWTASKLSL